ncbi:glycosyltransferase [bacterium]|nr:glycosyltransferase [bacterium]
MNKDVIYISDFFSTDVLGGCELNDQELILMLKKKKYNVSKIRSREVTNSFIKNNKNSFFIISNFISLDSEAKEQIQNLDYIIYEHDHKYLKERNPVFFKNLEAPQHKIINYFFYKRAKKIICQSSFHKEIVEKNLKLDNIVSVGGNLWSDYILNKIEEFSINQKNDLYSIMNSYTRHKNTEGSIKFCLKKNKKYKLIKDNNYEKFLEKLSKNQGFVFLPKSPETLSRVVVEARMLGCKVITNQMVGAAKEEWFNFKGKDLIDYMRKKKTEIIETIIDIIEQETIKKEKPLVSIVTSFYKAEEYLQNFLENITSQTIFSKCEMIILDTGSPGGEREIVESFCKKYNNIKYERMEERLTPTVAFNEVMKRCEADYINWAMTDDIKRKDNLEIMHREISKSPSIDLVYADCLITDIKNQDFDECKSKTVMEHSKLPFTKENMIKCLPGPMPLFSKNIINEVGFFNANDYKFSDDWDLWLRAVSHGFKFKKINKTLGLYLQGGRSQQPNNIPQRKEEARIFFKYSHIFGNNYHKYYPYFKQFISQ